MRILLLVTSIILLTSCATQPYKGSDGGYLVMAIGKSTDIDCGIPTVTIYSYDDMKGYQDIKLPYVRHGLFGEDNYDYKDSVERGDVRVVKLKPGQYSIGWFEAGCGNLTVKNKDHLGIKFKIMPNQTTYIGNFQANLITSKFLGVFNTPKLIYFYLTDRNKQDIALAKNKTPELPYQDIIISLPDVKSSVYITDKKTAPPKE